MKSLHVEDQTYICAHWKVWPPKGHDRDPKELWGARGVTVADYSRVQVWRRICGLTEMSSEKCLECPHRMRVEWRTTGPFLVTPEGVASSIVDPTTLEVTPTHNHLIGIAKKR